MKVILNIEGMSCGHCVKAVTNAVAGIPGINDVSVDLENGLASFDYDPDKTLLETVITAITEEGYTVRQ